MCYVTVVPIYKFRPGIPQQVMDQSFWPSQCGTLQLTETETSLTSALALCTTHPPEPLQRLCSHSVVVQTPPARARRPVCRPPPQTCFNLLFARAADAGQSVRFQLVSSLGLNIFQAFTLQSLNLRGHFL